MSTQEQEFAEQYVRENAEARGRESGLLRRVFEAEPSSGEGRTIDVRIVPYGKRIRHNDGHGGVPRGVFYDEEFAPGAFSHQVNAANRVLVNFEHQEGLAGVIGHGKALLERQDGLYGSFKIHETPDGDKALMLVREGVLHGVSMEARPVKAIRTAEGVIRRVKAHLFNIALARAPAYEDAVVLALREEEIEEEPVLDEELQPLPMDPALLERTRSLGVALPGRLEDMLVRAFTEEAWDGSASRWSTPAAYCSASAIDLNPAGQPKTKDRCHLPYKEPGSGMVNVNGVRAALSRIGQGFPQDATQEQRDAARRRLERLLAEFNGQQ